METSFRHRYTAHGDIISTPIHGTWRHNFDTDTRHMETSFRHRYTAHGDIISTPIHSTWRHHFDTDTRTRVHCLLSHTMSPSNTQIRIRTFLQPAGIYRVVQKIYIYSLLINIFGINLNEISISGWVGNWIQNSRSSLIYCFCMNTVVTIIE
jgi:hypothetical protein